MEIRINFTTYGGEISKHCSEVFKYYRDEFRYFSDALSEFIIENEIETTLKYLEISFYFYRKIKKEEEKAGQDKCLSSIPRTRFLKNRTELYLEKQFFGIDNDMEKVFPTFDDVFYEMVEVFKIIEKKKG